MNLSAIQAREIGESLLAAADQAEKDNSIVHVIYNETLQAAYTVTEVVTLEPVIHTITAVL